MSAAARLVFPAIRWRSSTGFQHERARIDTTLKLGVGGYILFGGRAADVRTLTQQLQSASAHPLLIGSDLERGAGQQFDGLTHLPSAAALGFLGDAALARRCGEVTAREARSVGVNWVYAPVADLDREPENPIVQTRSFGDDPARVAGLVSQWIVGAQAAGVAAAAKHYPGHGRTTADSHATLPVVDTALADLEANDLLPFRAAIDAGVRSIMTAHVAYSAWEAGVPATLSPVILAYLRERLSFDGPIVTDAFIMEGALRGRSPGRAAVAAISAGCDALLYPRDAVAVAAALDAAAADPAVRARIEAAADRVARLAESVQGPVGSEPDLGEHRRFADATADLAVHTLRGDSLNLVQPLAVTVVDDDIGGPYSVGPRDLFARTLRGRGVRFGAGGSRVTLVYSEPRSWKGRASLGPRSLAALRRTPADLVMLLGHPRLVSQIPGEAPVVCAWHGQPLMQEAAGRWVANRLR